MGEGSAIRITAAVTTTTFRFESVWRLRFARRPGLDAAGFGRTYFASKLALLGLVVLSVVGCRCESQKPEKSAIASSAPQPPRPPAGLVAELGAPDPQELWERVREVAGSKAAAAPQSLALALAQWLGFPLNAAGAFDLSAPMSGALIESAKKSVTPVVLVHVRSGRELIAQLTTGQSPPFNARPMQRVTELMPAGPTGDVHLSVFENYLVVSPDASVSESTARYLAGLASRRPVPSDLLVLKAAKAQLAGPLSELLTRWWNGIRANLEASQKQASAQQAGRPPDFGEPSAVQGALGVGIDALLALVDSSRELTVGLMPTSGHWTLRATLLPEARGAAHDLVTEQVIGSAAPLRALPAATALAVLSRSTSQQRRRAAEEVTGQLSQLFARRISEAEQKKLGSVLQQFAAGRGDATVLGLLVGKTPGLIVQADAADATEIEEALEGVPELLRMDALSGPLEDAFGRMRFTAKRGSQGGQAMGGFTMFFGDGGRLALLKRTEIVMLWQKASDRVHVSLGPAPGAGLLDASLHSEATLGDQPEVGKALERVGRASFILLTRPGLLGVTPGAAQLNKRAPLVISGGNQQGTGFLQVELPAQLLRAYLDSMSQL